MGGAWLQFVASGLTAGAIYALVALGFTIVFNASGAINFAQGEFVMVGGMSAATLVAAGVSLPLAILLALAAAIVVALVIERVAISPARHAGTVTLIIITIGVSLFLRGLAQLVWGKGVFRLPAFSGEEPIAFAGATLLPQSLWVLGGAALAVIALRFFYGRTLAGKAMLATSFNRLAALLVGINTRAVLFASFGLAAFLGAVAGVLIAPIAFTSYDAGIMLGLKGFAAAMLGGLGSFPGAVLGGLVLGLLEGLGAGFVSSAYKDAIAFVVILGVLFFLPGGFLGARSSDRV
ncbi:branched-chain amino acid ABC transporter permease [Ramlibacter monticola]|uniref:Branched-chain amino acid ABC transporter permease n=1 Tax=Ramlibacter monticola TaxID=1926872 RepID=A0A936YXT6_9BURK|nr:branched-chain amino acid ABC transporter permease [Ramlibacter monticola]MBL0390868.1 branched-chain amino acid ABC transporter permease [Ramlibacter monticola]